MLGVLFQQTANYVSAYEDEVSDWEHDAIDAVLGYDDLASRYNPVNADPVKFMWNADSTTEQFIEYIKVYFYEGFKRPGSYFHAWFATAQGYLLPSSGINIFTGASSCEWPDKYWQPEQTGQLRTTVEGAYVAVSQLPGIGFLFSIGLYTCIIPLIATACFAFRRKELLPIMVPVVLSLGCCLITPVIDARYALPLIYTSPILFAVAITASVGKDPLRAIMQR